MSDSSPSAYKPHDQFFKALFQSRAHAESFLKATLPKAMWKQIDFNSLVPDPTEYLNEELKAFYADVVYSA